jgi:hypothetical protein
MRMHAIDLLGSGVPKVSVEELHNGFTCCNSSSQTPPDVSPPRRLDATDVRRRRLDANVPTSTHSSVAQFEAG